MPTNLLDVSPTIFPPAANCSNCLYGQTNAADPTIPKGVILCRANAPTAIEATVGSQNPNPPDPLSTLRASWPQVEPNHWCGIYKTSPPPSPYWLFFKMNMNTSTDGIEAALFDTQAAANAAASQIKSAFKSAWTLVVPAIL